MAAYDFTREVPANKKLAAAFAEEGLEIKKLALPLTEKNHGLYRMIAVFRGGVEIARMDAGNAGPWIAGYQAAFAQMLADAYAADINHPPQ